MKGVIYRWATTLEAGVKEAGIFGEGRLLELSRHSQRKRYDEDLTFLFGQCFNSLGTQHSHQGLLA